MKAKFIKYVLIIGLIACCFYILGSYCISINQAFNTYKEKITAINKQIDAKLVQRDKSNEALAIITEQNSKKIELYENVKKWNEEILTYIN